jgi:hypothetical protein
MAKLIKRKVRRNRHRPEVNRTFRPDFFAPIAGEDPRVIHRFSLIEVWHPLPLPDPDQDVYLREV